METINYRIPKDLQIIPGIKSQFNISKSNEPLKDEIEIIDREEETEYKRGSVYTSHMQHSEKDKRDSHKESYSHKKKKENQEERKIRIVNTISSSTQKIKEEKGPVEKIKNLKTRNKHQCINTERYSNARNTYP